MTWSTLFSNSFRRPLLGLMALLLSLGSSASTFVAPGERGELRDYLKQAVAQAV